MTLVGRENGTLKVSVSASSKEWLEHRLNGKVIKALEGIEPEVAIEFVESRPLGIG